MSSSLMACRILRSAEDDLRQVIAALIRAEPAELEIARKLLEKHVGALGGIHASAHREPALPLKEAVVQLRKLLGQAESLSLQALGSLHHQVSLAGLNPADVDGSLHLEA